MYWYELEAANEMMGLLYRWLGSAGFFKVLIGTTNFHLSSDIARQIYMVATYPIEIIRASTVIRLCMQWLQVFATKEFMYSINCRMIEHIVKVRQ